MLSKPIILGTVFASVAVFVQSGRAQSFLNLNFESAILSPTSGAQQWPNYVSASSGLPDWTPYLGTVAQMQVNQNTYTGGTASIDIFGPNWTTQSTPAGTAGILDGEYTIYLQTGVGPPDYTGGVNASIAQTGTLSGNVQSIQFMAAVDVSALEVSFDGTTLPLVSLGTGEAASGEDYTLFGANISAFAGQTGQLEFTEQFNEHYPSAELDDISFSTTAVPEPDPFVLTGLGGMALFLWRRFRS